ncbi:MAG: glycine zipper 2TM domain-containing protein, partial [Pseudomonadota bacterium]
MARFRRVTTLTAAAMIGALALAGCARQISPDVQTGRQAGVAIPTQQGIVENARLVEIQESDTLEGNGTGKLLGAVAGGIAGARFGDGVGRALASLGGAVIGSFLGAVAEQEIKRQPAMEYIIRTDRGDLLTIVQGMDPRLLVGQRVYVQDA